VNPPTAKRMMTKRFKNKINNQVVKEAAKYGITNLNATRLDLSNKGLAKIPDFVFYMKNLNYLFLTENNLTSLPAEIGQLKKLTILNIGDNKLTSLPATIGQLTNLNVLYLYENELTSLPATIGQLKNLEELELTHNNLTSLPATIGQLKKLSTLTSAHNELTSLPATIGQMKNLKKLNVSFNRISSLPTTIGRLRNLERFDLGHNELTSLPESFKNLSDSVVIRVDYGKKYTKQQFMKQFKPKRINKNTELFNAGVYLTNNIPRGKRAYISTPSDVKNNGTLRRVYNKNGLNEALRIRGGRARLHGNNFQQTTLDSSTIKTLIYNASVCVFSTHP
jgi:Leucine-rich repeat (LRR) protein